MAAKKKSGAKKSARKVVRSPVRKQGAEAVPSAPIDNPSDVSNAAEPRAPNSAPADAQPFLNPAAPMIRGRGPSGEAA